MDKQSWKPRVGMKPLSERDENKKGKYYLPFLEKYVGMKPLSERDENILAAWSPHYYFLACRNEATL